MRNMNYRLCVLSDFSYNEHLCLKIQNNFIVIITLASYFQCSWRSKIYKPMITIYSRLIVKSAGSPALPSCRFVIFFYGDI